MKRSIIRTAVAAIAIGAAILSGCSSSSSTASAGASGVVGSKKLVDLTDAEKKQLCDWQASMNGGYGHVTACGDAGVTSVNSTAAECSRGILTLPATCTAVVSQAEDCIIVLSKDVCIHSTSGACAPLFTPECRASTDGG